MDCRKALEILDVARPDSDDLSLPELRDAAAHLESHAACREEFERRQQLDREMSDVMQDVAVPAGLKSRLLERLAEMGNANGSHVPEAAETTSQVSNDTRVSRRSWLRIAAGVAASVATAVVVWQSVRDKVKPIEATSLQTAVANTVAPHEFQFAELGEFAGTAPPLPPGWEDFLTVDARPRAYRPQGWDGPALAIYRFRFTDRGRQKTGYLLAAPAEWVSNPPAATSFGGATPNYPAGMVARTWHGSPPGGTPTVYVCILHHDDTRAFERILHPTTA